MEQDQSIKATEDLLLSISKQIEQARLNAWLAAGDAVSGGVFNEAWKLACGRESRGTCPCCGRDRGAL